MMETIGTGCDSEDMNMQSLLREMEAQWLLAVS
jgi:hypothetical protein